MCDWQEVDWIKGDSMETLHWRTCDFCFETYMEDVWANRPIRKFYLNESECGLVACEHCLPMAMADEPVIVEGATT